MRSMPAAILLGSGLLLAASAAVADDPAALRPLAFLADAKVTLDAAGKPLAVEASEDLPAPVRQFIEQRVAHWTFSPPGQGGVTGPAVTYLQLDACALPAPGGGYRMAVDYKGNGPRYAGGVAMTPPAYPRYAKSRGMTATVVVTYVVGPDGSAKVEKLDYKQGARARSEFDTTLEHWVGQMRYEPEQLGGQPVATRVSVEVAFAIRGKTVRRNALDEADTKSAATASGECRVAMAEGLDDTGLQPTALDSPVRVEPAG